MTDEEEQFEFDAGPSKSQRKREAHAQQKLGERLAELPETTLKRLPLSDALLANLLEFKMLPNSNSALKRQRQFIGKLMRGHDVEEIESILASITDDKVKKRSQRRELVDEWVNNVLTNGDEAINALVLEYPQLDRQTLRQLARNHSRAADNKKAATHKKLHEFIKASIL
ncbi:MAG: ribosome biogenesis factor YjgA [Gammaproteobacteria bacterium]